VRRLAFVGILLGGFVGGAARADIDLPTVPPPQPEAVAVKVFLGESIQIPLRGVSRGGQPLTFLIRRAPQAGRLSPITSVGRNEAVVTYTHDRSAGAVVDRFRYAVQAPNTGVSTPAEVIVNVVERPSVFTAPATVEFPDTAIGDSSRQSFEVRNDGGGRLTGEFTVPEPWKLVEGEGSYSLGEGESVSFTVTFTPTDNRRFIGEGTFSHGEGFQIALTGRGYAPIEVVPREVRVEGDGHSEVRTGGFLLRNVSNEDRELTIQAPKEVIVQDTVTVPARSETQVAVHTRAGFLGALSGTLAITGSKVKLDVPLRVEASPARMIVHPEAIDFGTLAAGRYGRVKMTLKNIGGSPAQFTAAYPEGTMLDPDPSYEALAPGAVREFSVSFARPGAATLDGALAFDMGGVRLSVPMKAKVTEHHEKGDESPVAPSGPPPVKTNDLPPVEQMGFAQTKTRLDLTWKRTSPEIVRYGLILREIGFDAKGEAVFKYKPLPRVKPRFVRDEVRATLEGLRPGEHITLLIVGYDASGTPTVPSPPFVVFTKPTVPLRIPWFWIGVLAIIVCAGVIVRERRRARKFAGVG